jgi:hypothetical protein
MIFIYSPFDIYLNNPTAFVVSWKFLLLPLLVLFSASFITMSIVLILLLHKKIIPGIVVMLSCVVFAVLARMVFALFNTAFLYILVSITSMSILWFLMKVLLKDKAADVILLTLWGLLISAYVQVLILNGNMDLVIGARLEYQNSLAITNLLIWVVITLLPMGIWVLLMIRKKQFKYEKILVFSVIIIAGMQLAGLVSTAITTNLPIGFEEDNSGYVSYDAKLNLSSDENIIVFIVDKLDVSYTQEALKTYPHIRGIFDGFTHYENNIAEYFDTLPSITSMLTQHYYEEGLTINEYLTQAWAQHSYIDTLREYGFSTNLYLDYLSTYGSLSDIRNKTDNLRQVDDLQVNIRGVFSVNLRLSLGRLSPYMVKNTFFGPLTPAFGNSFFTFVIADPLSAQPPIVSLIADMKFHDYILSNEMSSGNDQRVFNVMHMNGGHGAGRNIPGVLHSFEVLGDYFDKMKEIGVYDNSTIIVLGDHGARYKAPDVTSLLIKPRGSRGELIIDSESELSHSYFTSSILEIAGITHGEPEITYFDIIDSATAPTRVFYYTEHWWTAWTEYGMFGTMTFYGLYKISGDASDISNWEFIPAP